MKWIPHIVCLCLLVLVSARVSAEPQAGMDAAEVKRLVEQMGHEDFKLRQQASDALMARVEEDPEFAKSLMAYANHGDPEIRVRIAELTKDLPVILQWMDPAREKEVKSLNMSPDRLKLTFKNRSEITIKAYWIDWAGKRQARRTLKPGEEGTIAVTFREHYWLITDENGKALGLYCPGKKDAQIIFTGKEGN